MNPSQFIKYKGYGKKGIPQPQTQIQKDQSNERNMILIEQMNQRCYNLIYFIHQQNTKLSKVLQSRDYSSVKEDQSLSMWIDMQTPEVQEYVRNIMEEEYDSEKDYQESEDMICEESQPLSQQDELISKKEEIEKKEVEEFHENEEEVRQSEENKEVEEIYQQSYDEYMENQLRSEEYQRAIDQWVETHQVYLPLPFLGFMM